MASDSPNEQIMQCRKVLWQQVPSHRLLRHGRSVLGGFPKKKDREASCHLSLVSIIRNLTPQLGRHGHTFHNVFFLK